MCTLYHIPVYCQVQSICISVTGGHLYFILLVVIQSQSNNLPMYFRVAVSEVGFHGENQL